MNDKIPTLQALPLRPVVPYRPPETKLAVNKPEAARLLSVSTDTIDRLVKRGLLHPSRATRHALFAIRELERFLEDTK